MHKTSKEYSIAHEDTFTVNEAARAYEKLTQSGKRKVNIQELMTKGYMTLEQSKTLIEKKIQSHFHNR